MSGNQPPVVFQVRLNATEDTHFVYANAAEVTSNLNDVSILFARIPPKMSEVDMAEATKTGFVDHDAMLEVVLPAQVLPLVINVLTAHRDSYESRFGKIPSAGQ